jgi:hypothetical protein
VSRFIGGGGIPADTNPPQPDNGKQWVDTSQSPPEVKIYDSATQAWLPADTTATVVSQSEPTPEVGKIWFEPAQNGTNMYAASSERWEFLKFLRAIPDSVVSRPNDNNSSSTSDSFGHTFTTDVEWSAIGARLSGNVSGVTQASLIRDNDGSVLDETDISGLSSGDAFTFTPSSNLVSGETYLISVDAEGSSYTRGYLSGSNLNYPYVSADGNLEIIDGSKNEAPEGGGSGGNIYEIGDIGLGG